MSKPSEEAGEEVGGAGTDARRVAGAATRSRLIEAATAVLSTDGVDGLTVRAVSQAADANVAAVKYHFGSRDNLIAVVVKSITEPVISAQREALTALEAAPSPPPARAWVEAWGRSLIFGAVNKDEFGLSIGRIVGQVLAAPESSLEVAVRSAAAETDERLIKGLSQALPDLPEATLRLRLAIMVSAISGISSGSFETHLSSAEPEVNLEDRLLEILVRLATDPAGESHLPG